MSEFVRTLQTNPDGSFYLMVLVAIACAGLVGMVKAWRS